MKLLWHPTSLESKNCQRSIEACRSRVRQFFSGRSGTNTTPLFDTQNWTDEQRREFPYRFEDFCCVLFQCVPHCDMPDSFFQKHQIRNRTDMGCDAYDITQRIAYQFKSGKYIYWGNFNNCPAYARFIGYLKSTLVTCNPNVDMSECVRMELKRVDSPWTHIQVDMETELQSLQLAGQRDEATPTVSVASSDVTASAQSFCLSCTSVGDSESLCPVCNLYYPRAWQSDALQILIQKTASSAKIDNGTNESRIYIQAAPGSGKGELVPAYIKFFGNRRVVIYVPFRNLARQVCCILKRANINHRLVGDGVGYQKKLGDTNVIVCLFNSARHLKDEIFDIVWVDECHLLASTREIEDLDDDDEDPDDTAAEMVENAIDNEDLEYEMNDTVEMVENAIDDEDLEMENAIDDEDLEYEMEYEMVTDDTKQMENESDPSELDMEEEDYKDESYRICIERQCRAATIGSFYMSGTQVLKRHQQLDYDYTPVQAIEAGDLVDIQTHLVRIDITAAATTHDSAEPGFSAFYKQLPKILHAHLYKFSKMMVVFNTTKRAERACESLKLGGGVNIFIITGRTPTIERERILDIMRDASVGRALLIVVKCCTTGTNIPALDALWFADQKMSSIEIKQTAFRVMRSTPTKAYGHLLIPVWCRRTDDKELVIEDNRQLRYLIRALSGSIPKLKRIAQREQNFGLLSVDTMDDKIDDDARDNKGDLDRRKENMIEMDMQWNENLILGISNLLRCKSELKFQTLLSYFVKNGIFPPQSDKELGPFFNDLKQGAHEIAWREFLNRVECTAMKTAFEIVMKKFNDARLNRVVIPVSDKFKLLLSYFVKNGIFPSRSDKKLGVFFSTLKQGTNEIAWREFLNRVECSYMKSAFEIVMQKMKYDRLNAIPVSRKFQLLLDYFVKNGIFPPIGDKELGMFFSSLKRGRSDIAWREFLNRVECRYMKPDFEIVMKNLNEKRLSKKRKLESAN